jgi:hypothetical protein
LPQPHTPLLQVSALLPEQSVFDAHSAQVPLAQNGVDPEQSALLVHPPPPPPPPPPADLHRCSWQVFSPEQVAQVPPPDPQAESLVPRLHSPFLQQPSGQVAAEQVDAPQVPLLQGLLAEHRMHAPPCDPQAIRSEPGRQIVPSQQPGQVCFVHFAVFDAVQTPLMQANPC